jgi:hypothetical protein
MGGQIDVSWTAPANNGDAVKQYYLSVFENGNKVKTLTVTGTSQAVQDLNPESSYTFTVQAENKAGKSPVSPQSAAEPAYGTPDVPGGVQASNPGDHKADVSWNAVSSSSFRGPGHRYEIRANGGAATRLGDVTSYAYTGLTNGTSYTFQVQACNQYICSEWSAPSNAVVPYGLPPKPSITAVGGDRKVTFSWDARATNGRDTTVRVTGAVTSTAKEGTASADAGYSDRKEACVVVRDSEGQEARDCAAATSDVQPDPRAWVSRGSKIPGPTSGCGTGECWYFVVNTQDFNPGTYNIGCQDYDGSWGTFATDDNVRLPAQGQAQTICYYGETQRVRVTVNGKAYEDRSW